MFVRGTTPSEFVVLYRPYSEIKPIQKSTLGNCQHLYSTSIRPSLLHDLTHTTIENI